MPATAELDNPPVPADQWLVRQGWKQVWPLASAPRHALAFAGPLAQRYLRIATNRNYYIWSRRLDLDPYQFPFLEILWGVDRFPQQAALDVRGRNDRPIVVMLSFGPKVASPSLLPDVPRALAFFWGETETVGVSYTCVMPRNGPEEVRLQCRYPHVQYVALRRGMTGTVHTDRVNLLEMFQQHFPTYWQEHQRVPPVVAVSFEAGSNQTDSASNARLYAITFSAADAANGSQGRLLETQRQGQ
jgi:hypothetical protein